MLAARIPEPVAIALTFVTVNVGWAFFCMDMRRVLVAFSSIARLA